MAEKFVTETDVIVGALDDAGDIAHGVAFPAVHFHYANLRVEV